MKAKTKIQKLVVSLNEKLPVLSTAQKNWMKNTQFEFCYYKTLKLITCLECATQWKRPKVIESKIECPNCKKKLSPLLTKKRSLNESLLMCIMTTKAGFQIFRYFGVHRQLRAGEKAAYFFVDSFAHWIGPKGEHVLLSKLGVFGYYANRWPASGSFELRPYSDNRYIHHDSLYPRCKIQPKLTRNGFEGSFHKLHPVYFTKMLLKESRFETLLKCKQLDLMNDYYRFDDKIKKYWNQIKICIRNNYLINQPSIWFDYIEFLERYGKDLNNTKYVCPDNLKKAHDKYVEKARKERIAKEIEALKEEMDQEDIVYQKRMRKYLSLEITNSEIVVRPLQNVQEFFVEGNTLNHCVFHSEYYKKKDALILTAQKDGERLETIYVDLKNLKILECRGNFNENSKYHDEIVKLVQTNIKNIKKHTKKAVLV